MAVKHTKDKISPGVKRKAAREHARLQNTNGPVTQETDKNLNQYTIGQNAKALGISPQTVRHYESLGLFASERDAQNQYRTFSTEDMRLLFQASIYWSMGFSLGQIKAMLKEQTTVEIQDIFDQRIEKVQQEIDALLEQRREQMKITVLIENTSDSDLICEHGLSLLIEYHGENYLLDAGQSRAFMKNAKALGAPVLEVNTCILSHGHYDHAGGFAGYLKENQRAVVYAMKGADEDYYSASGGMHAIGIPEQVLSVYQERFCYIDCMTEIVEGMYLLPHHTSGLDKIGERAGLFRKEETELVPDDFRHELSLVIDTARGLVVCNSCSHAGIQNILTEVQEAFPDKKVYAFVGGLHMKGKCEGKEICIFSEEEIIELSEYLQVQEVCLLYTGHCTGRAGFDLLKKHLGEKVCPLTTGREIMIED